MGNVMTYMVVGTIIFIAIVTFILFLLFKQIQFWLSAVNLYKQMVEQQRQIVGLLLDIRDGTSKFVFSSGVSDDDSGLVESQESAGALDAAPEAAEPEEPQGPLKTCLYCGKSVRESLRSCSNCGCSMWKEG